jgi:hypothetical protein
MRKPAVRAQKSRRGRDPNAACTIDPRNGVSAGARAYQAYARMRATSRIRSDARIRRDTCRLLVVRFDRERGGGKSDVDCPPVPGLIGRKKSSFPGANEPRSS